jgi:hypothetical protein
MDDRFRQSRLSDHQATAAGDEIRALFSSGQDRKLSSRAIGHAVANLVDMLEDRGGPTASSRPTSTPAGDR